MPELINLENIPVCETGIDYPASTGPISLTTQMFEEAVRFTQDPHGLNPRIKISHGANPIDDDLQSLFEAYNQDRDASLPALGTILNLRTHNAGHTLVGDWYGLPEWLAEILPSAYPARSIEGDAWHNPANQKSYDFVISAVALLGVVGPGCTSLDDLQELFSKEGPKIQVIEMAAPKMDTSTKMEGGPPKMPADLQVNVEDIRRSFYDDFAQGERYWWWDRELLADPWEFIVSDLDSGQLYRVPFTPEEDENGDTRVAEWGEPDPVKIQYVPDKAAKESVEAGIAMAVRSMAPQLPNAGILLAVNTTPPRKREKEAKPAMGIDINAVRALTGKSEEDLPDDASEETINAALAEANAAAEKDETTVAASTATTELSVEAARAVIEKNGGTVVDAGVWERTKSGAELAHEQAKTGRINDDKALLEATVKRGAIVPAAREGWLAKLAGPNGDHDAPDRDAVREYLTKLESGFVPVDERGTSEQESRKTAQMGTGLFDFDDNEKEA